VDRWIYYIDLANKICKKLGFGFIHRENMNLAEDPSSKALAIDEHMMASNLKMSKQLVSEEMDIFS